MIFDTKELIEVKQLPKFNEIGFISNTSPYDFTQPFSYVSLVDLVKKSPEIIGILHAIQIDICSDGYRFEGARKNVEKAEEFASQNRFKSEFAGTIFDWLMLGNGGLWRGKMESSTIKEILAKVSAVTGTEIKETELKQYVDEDFYQTKLLKHVPWSTMNIDLNEDKTSIKQFRQKLPDATAPIIFRPEEIIHGKFMEFNGKVYGFAPLEASVNVLSTLLLIKDLNGAFFDNGGVPDWMFILPKEMANSPNVKKLEQSLRKYKGSRNKHGNLIFTGEVETVPMNKFDKDMEYRQMAIYYTGILALAYNMPMARVASILGAEVKASAADSDLSESGYWRGIASYQDYWEDLLNSQLWLPEFKVTMRFNRGYKNDEIKEAQRDVQQFEVLNNLMKAGAITPEYIKRKLYIPDEFWTGEFNVVEMQSSFGGNAGSPGSPNGEDMDGKAKQDNNVRKKQEAKKAIERKELFFEVSAKEFDDLVQRWVKTSATRKVNWFEEGEMITFIVSTPDDQYSLTARKQELSPVKVSDWIGHGRKVESIRRF